MENKFFYYKTTRIVSTQKENNMDLTLLALAALDAIRKEMEEQKNEKHE